ncbi:DNA-binding protein [Staphylococcus epidermidis]|uniref:Gldg family protein n=1 Tax=Staphylococcus epidermidis TaxID=1282 RepID=UPI000C165B70|nr:DNA-binding protein [Staphylococcus epidermidis]ATQ60618.1 DNA-binding protein [Staphylococcus epidermidis]MCG2208021.1 DNA-binding protein [Staphylococcus epidermidis]MEB7744195.1 DNA-binding protein [Staphylococcus epidermidis]
MKIFKTLSSILVTSVLSVTVIPSTFASTESTATNQTQQTVLFDNSHAQTAGAADWVIDGAFSDYADSMRKQGYQVKELEGKSNISDQSLQQAHVLVIPEANNPFKENEQKAIINFVKNGGSVIFISDHYNADRNLNRIDSSESMNGYRRGAYQNMTKDMNNEEKNSNVMHNVKSSDWLSQNFGVRFRYNALGDINTQNIVSSKDSFGITKGVHSVSMHSGSTLAITNPNKAKGIIYMPEHLTHSQKWSHAVDQGIYNGGGINEGPYVAISKIGKGKAAFIGDSSLVEDRSPKYLREDNGKPKKTYDGFKEQDNGKLLNNLTTWLGKKESQSSMKDMGIKLDHKTPLLNFEQPENSIEPQKEPWTNPIEGYKWYDRSTFKKGSYGSDQQGADDGVDDKSSSHQKQNGKVELTLPQNIQPHHPFQFTIKLTGYEPNSTINDVRVGLYKDGGKQIGSFSSNRNQFNTPGYSPSQSIKTNGAGEASITLTARVTDEIKDANIRVKQGKKILLTQKMNENF